MPATKDEYLSLMALTVLVVTNQDRLLVSQLRHECLLEMSRLFTVFDKKQARSLRAICWY